MGDAILEQIAKLTMSDIAFIFLIYPIIFFLMTLLMTLLMRPFWCWYFKINVITDLLTEIRNTLSGQTGQNKLDGISQSTIKYSGLSPDNPRNIENNKWKPPEDKKYG